MKFRYLNNVVTLKLDQDKCSGCGLCVEVCPQAVYTLNGKVSLITDRDACLECGACAQNCAPGAITVRPGVGCAFAILMDMFNIKSQCCGDACSCSLDNVQD